MQQDIFSSINHRNTNKLLRWAQFIIEQQCATDSANRMGVGTEQLEIQRHNNHNTGRSVQPLRLFHFLVFTFYLHGNKPFKFVQTSTEMMMMMNKKSSKQKTRLIDSMCCMVEYGSM